MHLINIGKWKVFPIETGLFSLDGGAMMGTVPKVLWEKTNPSDQYNRIDLALRCLFADDGKHKILIETGIGDKNSENKLQTIINNKIEPALIAALFPKNLVLTNCIWVAV